ncbi:MAG: ABC transporter ATP-binding protein [Gemmatimonadales bacterium]
MTALSLKSISKRFGAVRALDGVDFELAAGSVHALLGENGAGKSTLMHIAYGMLPADHGEIVVHGTPVRIHSPRDARRLGLGMVHQHFALVESMTVRENIQLVEGEGRREKGEATERSTSTSRFSLLASPSLPMEARVETLSVAAKQRLEITKALATGARILLLDEPTAVLAPPEIEELLGSLRAFADSGGSVVLITHKLREVFACADRVTVLRQGRVTLDGPVQGRSEAELAEAMVGEREGRREKGEATTPQVSTSRFSFLASPLPLAPGTILGIAAVEGNGQRELLRALAARESAAFIPEDRGGEALIPELSLTENIVLGLGDHAPWIKGPFVDWAAAHSATATLMAEHDVRATGPEALARTLSGGNQQKLVLARAFAQRPAVLVAENPTRGLDITATAEVHRRLRQAADEGVAVVIWSSDLDEVLELADRVVVVREEQVIEVAEGSSRMVVGRLMLGVQGEARREKRG